MLVTLKNVELVRNRETTYRLLIKHFSLEPGSYTAITGPSGCGKSTFLDLLGLLLAPKQAEEFNFWFSSNEASPINARKLWQKQDRDAMAELRRFNMGYVLQTGELLPFLNVADNIALSATLAHCDRISERVENLMTALQITNLAKAMPATLSIGERQRCAIARALVAEPKLLLADEPTASLDPLLKETVLNLFMQQVAKMQIAIVMVTHDVSLVENFHFRCLPMEITGDAGNMTAILDDSRS